MQCLRFKQNMKCSREITNRAVACKVAKKQKKAAERRKGRDVPRQVIPVGAGGDKLVSQCLLKQARAIQV